MHISIFPQEWSKAAPNIGYFLNNVLEWESRFTLGLNAAKSIDYAEKGFKQKLSEIKFPTKYSVDAYFYLH